MLKLVENKSKTNQLKPMNSNNKKTKQTKAWPLAFKPVVLGQKTFPKSWSAFPVSGSFS